MPAAGTPARASRPMGATRQRRPTRSTRTGPMPSGRAGPKASWRPGRAIRRAEPRQRDCSAAEGAVTEGWAMLDIRAEHNRGMAALESGDLGAALAALRAVMVAVPGNEEISRALFRLARLAGNGALGL